MRAIDADELKKALDELFKGGGYDSGLVMNTVDNAPTVELQMGRMTNGIIIPIERPTGEWIADYDNYCCNCSKCGKGHLFPHNYCPDCGARMKGEEE